MGVGEKANDTQAAGRQLVVRINNELRQALTLRAEAEQIGRRKLSRLYRALLWAGLDGDTIKTWGRALDELGGLRENLSRVGGNLNQVAHWLNAKGSLKDKELLAAIEELRPAVKQCYAIVKELKDGIVQRNR